MRVIRPEPPTRVISPEFLTNAVLRSIAAVVQSIILMPNETASCNEAAAGTGHVSIVDYNHDTPAAASRVQINLMRTLVLPQTSFGELTPAYRTFNTVRLDTSRPALDKPTEHLNS